MIRCLLIYPNAESALNEDAGKLILEDYADFEKRARLMTKQATIPYQNNSVHHVMSCVFSTRIHARPKENNSDVNQGVLPSSFKDITESSSKDSSVVKAEPSKAAKKVGFH